MSLLHARRAADTHLCSVRSLDSLLCVGTTSSLGFSQRYRTLGRAGSWGPAGIFLLSSENSSGKGGVVMPLF